ncbi:hypothetical protein HPP92_017410 [Vanilla planifolia]|uniref:Serine aminopeptidase S33 domain-containing protein n=1 Tax=Vanilla planifolia TaxID=51239 RepID=A0A835UNE5_VANPL|nr:hypothetical protein HPP92_017410 [Vanilla planifolia]
MILKARTIVEPNWIGRTTGSNMKRQEFVVSPRGLKLFPCRWLPANREPKALVFLCHGYAMECSVYMRGTGTKLVKAGFAVHGIDYEGHGKSDGLQGYVPSFDRLVDDCLHHFMSICEKPENKKKKRFLYGESMGGAVALTLHKKAPVYWNGAVLVAPMCKIADEMRPHPVVIKLLTKLSHVIPTWRIIPIQDIVDAAHKSPKKREEIRSNPLCYKGRPRLKTAIELFLVCSDIENNFHEASQ